MTNDLAISIRNISKVYEIYRKPGERAHSSNGRSSLSALVARGFKRQPREQFSALKGISFNVNKGEVIGLIGRNGAGKSTLLKILSRITEPTAGEIDIYGRVGSLLEVGTGFHPELTGRENVFLNGAILGMRKSEIARQFDAIVSFAEVEKFIDTPVKRYSSGMYVRLAFAVAAHLNPEILIVDEVLAVGDLSFQQKCLAHLSRLRDQGMTIFLVSHNMAAIQGCCTRGIVLDRGALVGDGNVLAMIEQFRVLLRKGSADATANATDQPTGDVEIIDFQMFGEDGVQRRTFTFGESVKIRIHVSANKRVENPMINFGIRRGDGVIICNFNNWYDNFRLDYIEGDCVLEGWLPPLRLVPDFYEVHCHVWPWGGAHIEGDLAGASPYFIGSFGDFNVEGIGLNHHDGVFQTPAVRWNFHRGDHRVEHARMTHRSIYDAFVVDQTVAPI